MARFELEAGSAGEELLPGDLVASGRRGEEELIGALSVLSGGASTPRDSGGRTPRVRLLQLTLTLTLTLNLPLTLALPLPLTLTLTLTLPLTLTPNPNPNPNRNPNRNRNPTPNSTSLRAKIKQCVGFYQVAA